MNPSRTPPPPGMRWMYAFLAVLYAFVLGVLLYFRFGPYRRVMERLAEDGVAMPGWFSGLFSFGILAVGLFLVWRGVGAARKALKPPQSDSE